ncbi:methyltransferase, FxLD system [Streptomyces virginiae]|uniref:methyltransferase, FxLD system n=1 Tax=Streptomyces virginiae TaxID=1961 RepID=UPI00344806D9
MSGGRHTVPVDVHLLAVRDGEQGREVLLSRRAGDVYASGLWHAPSGHVEFETVVDAVVRETREETGLVVDPSDVRPAVTVHHRPPGGQARIGFFFEVRRWSGTPRVMEPDKCDAIEWFALDKLPASMVAYCRAGLDAYRAGAPVAVHFQDPGDPIAYDPSADRLGLVADPDSRGAVPQEAVRAFTEQSVGRITTWTDVSWAREQSCVWRARGAEGGTWYVKIHQNERFHQCAVAALRGWVTALGAAAPRLVAADAELRAVVLTAVGGRSLHGATYPPEPAGGTLPLGKLERHLDGARPHLAPGAEKFVRATAEKAADLPALDVVPTHGDFQLRNLRWDGAADALYVIDFERSEEGPAVRDFVRLSDAWHGRPDLLAAVMDGYGRPFTRGRKPSSRPCPSWMPFLASPTALHTVIPSWWRAADAPWPGSAPHNALDPAPPHTRSSTLTYTARDQWEKHYSDGKNFRQVGERERELLAEHTPAPDGGGRALDVGCGSGELAAYLACLGYTVDAVDFADTAIARAREEHAGVDGVLWLHLDIEHDDWAPLHEEGYDLITLRLMYPFVKDRGRLVHGLGERLRRGGALVVITPVMDTTPQERRDIALDGDEIAVLAVGWETVERLEADGLTVLVLRGPCHTDTRAVEKRPTTGHALIGALAVVTDEAGRVLLGRSRRGMLELPGGKTDGSEDFAAAAVRELAEETALVADADDAYVLTMIVDDSHGVPRLTAVVRITSWSGTLGNPEPNKFDRWEFVDVHALACAGEVFLPAALALDAVWPGVIPDLPPATSYPLAGEQPAVPGEPAEAVRLRRAMVETVIDGGWAVSEPVRDALRTVPRHRFAPEKNLRMAYDAGDVAIVTRRNEAGRATSSVSAAWLQADMIEGLDLEPGAVVWEAGSGGYNAELLAHVVCPGGRVVTSDIDDYVVRRARRFTAEAGSGRVTVVHGDAAHGAPAHLVPRGGFDAVLITYNCWDIAPAWRDQLADGGRLVLPLELGGYTRAITFQRGGDVLVARKLTHCGFVPAQGAYARTAAVADLLDGQLQLRFEDGPAGSVEGLEEALRGRRHEIATGVTMGPGFYFGLLQLYAATTLTGFCRLAVTADQETSVVQITTGSDAPAVLGDASLAYLTYVQTRHSEIREEREREWFVHTFGDQGPALGEKLADAVRAWDRDVRGDGGQSTDPAVTVHPAGTPDHRLPPGDVVDKDHCRVVVQWPGRDALLPSPVDRVEAPAASGEGM